MVRWNMIWKNHTLFPLLNIKKIVYSITCTCYLLNQKIKDFLYYRNRSSNWLWWETLKWYTSKLEILTVYPPPPSSIHLHPAMVCKGFSSTPHKMLSIRFSPFPNILNVSPLNSCCLDWRCFLNWPSSPKTLPVISKCFDSEQY